MRFFVARVNLEEQSKLGARQLRPLQIAYENSRFMLPIRLGMVNAKGAQDLVVYGLTRTGRIETTNYRTVRVPTGNELPPYVKSEFEDFYRDLFARQVDREGGTAVFLEHAWDMGWCDPCASDPLSASELRGLGVFWTDGGRPNWRGRPIQPTSSDVFVTRLHIRYDAAHFPEDPCFQRRATAKTSRSRYVLRHPWTSSAECDEARAYRRELEDRQRRGAIELASDGWAGRHSLEDRAGRRRHASRSKMSGGARSGSADAGSRRSRESVRRDRNRHSDSPSGFGSMEKSGNAKLSGRPQTSLGCGASSNRLAVVTTRGEEAPGSKRRMVTGSVTSRVFPGRVIEVRLSPGVEKIRLQFTKLRCAGSRSRVPPSAHCSEMPSSMRYGRGSHRRPAGTGFSRIRSAARSRRWRSLRFSRLSDRTSIVE